MSMSNDEIVLVVRGQERGLPIQIRYKNILDSQWTDVFGEFFDFKNFDYRIKPESPKDKAFGDKWLADCIQSNANLLYAGSQTREQIAGHLESLVYVINKMR